MSVLQIDFETRATVDLRKTGVYPYAEHPDTDVWCMAWAFDDEEPEIWTPQWRGQEGVEFYESWAAIHFPGRVIRHIEAGGEIRAWNAEFERIIWNYVMVPRYGAPAVKLEQWHDTAAQAAMMALPRSLDHAAQVTGVQFKKDRDGYGLMLRMTKPRKVHEDGRIEWWTVEERLQRLFEYCKQDVRVERAVGKVLLPLPPLEREHYLETCRANDRGIPIDWELVKAAAAMADEAMERANGVLQELSNGAISEVTKVKQIKAWLVSRNIEAESISKATVREMLESDLDPAVRAVLEQRAEAGRSSLAKLGAMVACMCKDGMVRGTQLYHGAATGRWTAKLIQPHNFPKGEVEKVESFIPDVLAGRYDTIDLFYAPPVVISSMLRAMIAADDEHDLMAGDFSAIEARVVNWIAGQQDMIDLFTKMDAAPTKAEKELFDPYRHNAARIYNIPLSEVKKLPHRHTGKFQELACGFQMGPERAVEQGKQIYNIDLTLEQATEIVDNYRATHMKVKQLWRDANDAAIRAVENPGVVVPWGLNLRYIKQGGYLYMLLPSKRPLVYAAPRVITEWVQPRAKMVEGVKVTPPGFEAKGVEISAVNQQTRQWNRHRMYGGIWVENAVQALARDLLAEAALRLRDKNYPYSFMVHDEIVTVVPKTFGSLEEFDQIVIEVPEWAKGLPIATESWRGKRYRK